MYFFCIWEPWLRSSRYTCTGTGGPKTPSASCRRGGLPHETCLSWTQDSGAAQQPKSFQVKQFRLSYWHFLLALDKYFLEQIHLIYRGFVHMQCPTPLNTAGGFCWVLQSAFRIPPNCKPNSYHLCSEHTEVINGHNKIQGLRLILSEAPKRSVWEEANPASWKPTDPGSKEERCALGCRCLPGEPGRVWVLHITLAFPESCYERRLSEF